MWRQSQKVAGNPTQINELKTLVQIQLAIGWKDSDFRQLNDWRKLCQCLNINRIFKRVSTQYTTETCSVWRCLMFETLNNAKLQEQTPFITNSYIYSK